LISGRGGANQIVVTDKADGTPVMYKQVSDHKEDRKKKYVC
jgi:hypothetical protein